jgi:hypothetical protein
VSPRLLTRMQLREPELLHVWSIVVFPEHIDRLILLLPPPTLAKFHVVRTPAHFL